MACDPRPTTLPEACGVTEIPAPGNPGDAPRRDDAAALTGQGRLLVEALARKSSGTRRAIGMYLEAQRAIARDDGPESIHVAGYQLREFMNELPRALDLPVVAHAQLKEKVKTLVEQWQHRSVKSECDKDGAWTGEIDGHLRGALSIVTEFTTWVAESVPSRRVEIGIVVQRLSPTSHPLPPPLLKLRTDEWSALYGYFNDVLHHNHTPDQSEFAQKVARLESFLLEYLEPRTFEDQGAIDSLIEEVENE
jgi:hypothetical protein